MGFNMVSTYSGAFTQSVPPEIQTGSHGRAIFYK